MRYRPATGPGSHTTHAQKQRLVQPDENPIRGLRGPGDPFVRPARSPQSDQVSLVAPSHAQEWLHEAGERLAERRRGVLHCRTYPGVPASPGHRPAPWGGAAEEGAREEHESGQRCQQRNQDREWLDNAAYSRDLCARRDHHHGGSEGARDVSGHGGDPQATRAQHHHWRPHGPIRLERSGGSPCTRRA